MAKKIGEIEFLSLIQKELGSLQATRSQIKEVCSNHNIRIPRWLINDPERRVSHGVYSLDLPGNNTSPITQAKPQVPTAQATFQNIDAVEFASTNLIPEKSSLYVRWGHFDRIKQLIESKMFFPAYITGLSGNGKTLMIEQACAHLDRKMFRVNITAETEEDDLLGGFRLINGETVWSDGPVVRAMKEGAVLLLDEVDLGDEKLMCLQPVLEGKGVFLKKINQFVAPVEGFNVLATANTKGQGSEDGKFVGTNIMNEAFLERFPLTFEQPYPNKRTEKNILKKVLKDSALMSDEEVELYAEHLVEFAQLTRKAYENDSGDEVITTRRLVHIAKAYMIFQDKTEAIKHCISRFDQITQESFLDTYRGLDPVVIAQREEDARKAQEELDKKKAEKDISINDIFAKSS